MKANEIMIGDWVKFPIGNEKVCDLPYVEGKGLCASFAASATLFPVEVDELEPIPLTPEILEKNGFVEEEYPIIYDRREFELRHGDYRIIVSPFNDGYTRIYKGGYLPILNNCYINFVHELQHALRFCGIEKEIVI